MKETAPEQSSVKKTQPTSKKWGWVRKSLLALGIILGLFISVALLPALLKDDGLHNYTGVKRQVAQAALDAAYDTDMLPFFTYFVKATVEDVFPVCSKQDKKTTVEDCRHFMFDPNSTSSYNVKVIYYTYFGTKTSSDGGESKADIFKGLYLGV